MESALNQGARWADPLDDVFVFGPTYLKQQQQQQQQNSTSRLGQMNFPKGAALPRAQLLLVQAKQLNACVRIKLGPKLNLKFLLIGCSGILRLVL